MATSSRLLVSLLAWIWAIVARLRGEEFAKALQLGSEYAPDPPFNAGEPETAPPQITEHLRTMMLPFLEKVKEVVQHHR